MSAPEFVLLSWRYILFVKLETSTLKKKIVSFRICEFMLAKYYFGILVILLVQSAELKKGLENCKEQTRSALGFYLAGHLISTARSSTLAECVMLCLYQLRCKSLNFQLRTQSCDLNDADRHTHPEDYGRREASVYVDTSKKTQKGKSGRHTFWLVMEISKKRKC